MRSTWTWSGASCCSTPARRTCSRSCRSVAVGVGSTPSPPGAPPRPAAVATGPDSHRGPCRAHRGSREWGCPSPLSAARGRHRLRPGGLLRRRGPPPEPGGRCRSRRLRSPADALRTRAGRRGAGPPEDQDHHARLRAHGGAAHLSLPRQRHARPRRVGRGPAGPLPPDRLRDGERGRPAARHPRRGHRGVDVFGRLRRLVQRAPRLPPGADPSRGRTGGGRRQRQRRGGRGAHPAADPRGTGEHGHRRLRPRGAGPQPRARGVAARSARAGAGGVHAAGAEGTRRTRRRRRARRPGRPRARPGERGGGGGLAAAAEEPRPAAGVRGPWAAGQAARRCTCASACRPPRSWPTTRARCGP